MRHGKCLFLLLLFLSFTIVDNNMTLKPLRQWLIYDFFFRSLTRTHSFPVSGGNNAQNNYCFRVDGPSKRDTFTRFIRPLHNRIAMFSLLLLHNYGGIYKYYCISARRTYTCPLTII